MLKYWLYSLDFDLVHISFLNNLVKAIFNPFFGIVFKRWIFYLFYIIVDVLGFNIIRKCQLEDDNQDENESDDIKKERGYF